MTLVKMSELLEHHKLGTLRIGGSHRRILSGQALVSKKIGLASGLLVKEETVWQDSGSSEDKTARLSR